MPILSVRGLAKSNTSILKDAIELSSIPPRSRPLHDVFVKTKNLSGMLLGMPDLGCLGCASSCLVVTHLTGSGLKLSISWPLYEAYCDLLRYKVDDHQGAEKREGSLSWFNISALLRLCNVLNFYMGTQECSNAIAEIYRPFRCQQIHGFSRRRSQPSTYCE